MKKGFLPLLLAVFVLALTVTGCAGKQDEIDKTAEQNTNSAGEEKESVVSEQAVVSDTISDEAEPQLYGNGLMMEGPSEDGLIEIQGEVTVTGELDVIAPLEADFYKKYFFDDVMVTIYKIEDKLYYCAGNDSQAVWNYVIVTSQEEINKLLSIPADMFAVNEKGDYTYTEAWEKIELPAEAAEATQTTMEEAEKALLDLFR